jgi:hypothetical protein
VFLTSLNSNLVRAASPPALSFRLASADALCPRDATKKQFSMGWGDRNCSQLASVGPQLLANGSTMDYRSWNIEVISGRVVSLVTRPPFNGNMLCSGSLAVANTQSCHDYRVTIATSPVQDASDHFVMVPMPKNAQKCWRGVFGCSGSL